MLSTTLKKSVINSWIWLENKIIGLEPANQKVDIPTLLTVLAITLPLDALIYWRLYFENFRSDYFPFCFSLEDIPYILYDKGTYCWYIILLLSIPSILFLFNISKIVKVGIGLVFFGAIGYGLISVGGFDVYQIIVYGLLILFTNGFIYFYNRNALFAYSILIGLFFVISAKTDSKNAIASPEYKTIISKGGVAITNKKDTTRFYVGSTSNFILIYDKTKKELEKFERDSIR